eukprot:gb/GEZN01005942.1/.p1 GENE.gb/GEZN01005942.1/~~gb/GEZN01005942.1/.p1  ORF type:complete len:523 (-),score=69.94 gb/GEZN01005942.1/:163-1701(-)
MLRRASSSALRSGLLSPLSSHSPLIHPSVSSSSTLAPTSRRSFTTVLPKALTAHLKDTDAEVAGIISNEMKRQRESLCMIASENYTSQSVLDALGSVMQNKYSEGYPGARYYGGNEFIDQAESLCQQRALETYKLNPEEWGVNVQPLSGAPANFYCYTAVMSPHDRMMALDLPHGGHLSHGYQTPKRKVSAVSVYFECLPYRLNEKTGYIDYDTLEKNALLYRPKLLVTGASAYSRHIDYARMRKIADEIESYLLMDMAHISGLVAAGVMPSPFPFSDIVTTTTHKSLRGPRGAMIFFRKGVRKPAKGKKPAEMYDLESKINNAVFPGHQGGPHNHTITALAVALKQAQSPEFKKYGQQILDNMQALAKGLMDRGFQLVSGGTDNHLCLVDLTDKGLNGAKAERLLELVNISSNKNTVPGDVSAMNPHGLRFGVPALTTRGMLQADMVQVAEFISRAITLALNIQTAAGSTKMPDWTATSNKPEFQKEISALRDTVIAFSLKFPVPVASSSK